MCPMPIKVISGAIVRIIIFGNDLSFQVRMGIIDACIKYRDRYATSMISQIPHRRCIYVGVTIVTDAWNYDIRVIICAKPYPTGIARDLRNLEYHLISFGCGWIHAGHLF